MSRPGLIRQHGTTAAKQLVGRVPPVRRLREDRARLAAEVTELQAALVRTQQELRDVSGAPPLYPPGHFYSPLPDLVEVRSREPEIFWTPRALPGIDLRTEAQLALVDELGPLTADQPFGDRPGDGLRYGFDNDYFAWGDALVLYGMLRREPPARFVEVGSGWSSALVLDVNDRLLGGSIDLTFVEPYPDRLNGLLRHGDRQRATVLEQPVQQVEDKVFASLEAGDVLFIDSSHVVKVGSDVHHLVLDVLPSLPAGVRVHVHDVAWPFEYSPAWVYEGRAWNEAYLLRALLVDNARLCIELWNDYLRAEHADRVAAAIPLWARNRGTSLWLRTA